MDLALFFNPIAGKGKARRVAAAADDALQAAGHAVQQVEVGPAAVKSDKDAALRAKHAMAVVGGDGTVHALAPLAAKHRVPLYQLPTGTENLFAREFGMTRDPQRLIDTLRRIDPDDPTANVPLIDVAVCNKRTFLLMASIGFDANVVHRLAHNRRGSISHLSYLPHILAELVLHKPAAMRIEADGRVIVDGEHGWAVVANARQYALRVDPARAADPTDGLLDVVFLPYRRLPALVAWNLRCRFGRQSSSPKLVNAQAQRITIETDRPARYQLDGEAPLDSAGRDDLGPATTPLEISLNPAALPVLTPLLRPAAIPAAADPPAQQPSLGLRRALARSTPT